jgi:hypothetical protein
MHSDNSNGRCAAQARGFMDLWAMPPMGLALAAEVA